MIIFGPSIAFKRRFDATAAGCAHSGAGEGGRASEARRLGEIDPEAVAAALIASGHFGGGVAELPLHITLVDLGGRGKARAQGMAGEFRLPLALAEVAAHAGRERRMFDQPGDVPVGQAVGADLFANHPPEQRPDSNPGEFEPGFERGDGAGGLRGAAADFDLAPASLPPERQQQSLVEKFDPAAAEAVLPTAIEANDFRPPQAASEADEEDRPVAQAT